MKTFNLPDLGEGLPDAEIVEWLVDEGDKVDVDDPIVSMETAKAVVEVPSPFAGRIVKFHGGPGDVIKTGAPLADFEVEGEPAEKPEKPEAGEKGEGEGKAEEKAAEQAATQPEPAPDDAGQAGEERADTGTVVGNVTTSDEVLKQTHSTVGGVKVTPAVRALARKLKVDLGDVEPTGPDGVVTSSDVRKAAEEGPTRRPSEADERPSRPAPAPERSSRETRADQLRFDVELVKEAGFGHWTVFRPSTVFQATRSPQPTSGPRMTPPMRAPSHSRQAASVRSWTRLSQLRRSSQPHSGHGARS